MRNHLRSLWGGKKGKMCENEVNYKIVSSFKGKCDRCDTCYSIDVTDEKQIHTARIICKCGNSVFIS